MFSLRKLGIFLFTCVHVIEHIGSAQALIPHLFSVFPHHLVTEVYLPRAAPLYRRIVRPGWSLLNCTLNSHVSNAGHLFFTKLLSL
jgi:hypothetical protein